MDEIVDCEVLVAFYFANAGHIARAVGKRLWDRHGPRYELSKAGRVALKGDFDDDSFAERILTSRFRSRIQRNLFPKPNATAADYDRFVAIVAKARKYVQGLGPASYRKLICRPYGATSTRHPFHSGIALTKLLF